MFKTISICAALVVLGTGAVHAQQQQATLQTVALPGTGLDIVFAMPKSPAAIDNLAMSPDALVVNLIGGKLALVLNSQDEMLNAWNSLRRPGCAFQSHGTDGTMQTPIAVYVVPNFTTPAAIRTASLVAPQPAPLMRKVQVPGRDFDVVFAMTKTPVVVDATERLDSLAVYSAGSELAMAVEGDVERMFKSWFLCFVCRFSPFGGEKQGTTPPRAVFFYLPPAGRFTWPSFRASSLHRAARRDSGGAGGVCSLPLTEKFEHARLERLVADRQHMVAVRNIERLRAGDQRRQCPGLNRPPGPWCRPRPAPARRSTPPDRGLTFAASRACRRRAPSNPIWSARRRRERCGRSGRAHRRASAPPAHRRCSPAGRRLPPGGCRARRG